MSMRRFESIRYHCTLIEVNLTLNACDLFMPYSSFLQSNAMNKVLTSKRISEKVVFLNSDKRSQLSFVAYAARWGRVAKQWRRDGLPQATQSWIRQKLANKTDDCWTRRCWKNQVIISLLNYIPCGIGCVWEKVFFNTKNAMFCTCVLFLYTNISGCNTFMSIIKVSGCACRICWARSQHASDKYVVFLKPILIKITD